MFDNIQNLILDFGGVLVDLDRQGWIESFIKLGFNDFEEVFNDKGTNTVFKQFELGQISSEQFCKTLKHHCSAGTTDEQVAEAWNTLLTGIPRQRLRKLLSRATDMWSICSATQMCCIGTIPHKRISTITASPSTTISRNCSSLSR